MPAPNPPRAFTTELVVRFRDCDPMGHVNNAVYLTYFEVARLDFWHQVVGQAALSFIMAEAQVTFRAPATPGQRLRVHMVVESIRNKSWVFRYDVVDASGGTPVAEGRTVQVGYDYAAGASQVLSAALRERLEAWLVPAAD